MLSGGHRALPGHTPGVCRCADDQQIDVLDLCEIRRIRREHTRFTVVRQTFRDRDRYRFGIPEQRFTHHQTPHHTPTLTSAGIIDVLTVDQTPTNRQGPKTPGVRREVTPTCENAVMAFGQQAGPPATYRQVQQLTDLILAAGHVDFRDARGPLGLNQRQAGGKFTRDEAEGLIERLEAEAGDDDGDPANTVVRPPPLSRKDAERIAVLRKMPDDALAAELQRRGWVVMEP